MGIVNKKQTGSKRYLMKNDSLKGQHRINEQIRAKEVRIVGDEVEPKVYPIAQALRLAEEHEADLVEISPNAQPPVCRIIDYSKFLYQLKKRQKEQKAKQVKVNVKEIRFGPQTDDHDYNFKLKHAKGFLEDGDKVKAYVFFKGRSILFKEQGEVLLLRFANDLEDYAKVDQMPVLEGKRMTIQLSPKKVASMKWTFRRISIRKIVLKDSYDSIKVVVPGKTLNEVSKIISGGTDDEVRLYFTENHVLFEFDDTIVVSRLIEGEYFRIDQMLNSDYDTKLTVNKKEMLSCIDRTTMLIKDSDKKPIIIGITDHSMEVKLNSAYGSMKEELAIDKRGKDIMIGFNPKFLIDALRVIDDEMINIYMINPKAPCFIRNDEGTYIYLILPVNFNVY